MKKNKNLKENNIEIDEKLINSMKYCLEDLIKIGEKINDEKLINSMSKFYKCNFDIEDKQFIVHNILADLIEDNKKNVDTIQELVNIIQEALRKINDIYKPSPNIIKIKKILLKYKENN